MQEAIGPDFVPGEQSEDVETIGGLVFALAGRVPAKGEVVGGIKGFEFEVMQADPHHIRRVKIKRLKQRTPRPPKISTATPPNAAPPTAPVSVEPPAGD